MPRITDPEKRQYLDGLHWALQLNRVHAKDYQAYKRAYHRQLKGLPPVIPKHQTQPTTYAQQQARLAIIKELTDLARHTYAPRIITPRRAATKETMMRTRGTVKYEDGGLGNATTPTGRRMPYSKRKPIQIVKGGIKTAVKHILKGQNKPTTTNLQTPKHLTHEELTEKLAYYPELGLFEWNAFKGGEPKAAGYIVGHGRIDRDRDPLAHITHTMQSKEDETETTNTTPTQEKPIVHVLLKKTRRKRKRWWAKELDATELKEVRSKDNNQTAMLDRLSTLNKLPMKGTAERMFHTTTTLDIIASKPAYPTPPRAQRKVPKLSNKTRINLLKAKPVHELSLTPMRVPTKRRDWVPRHTGHKLTTELHYNEYHAALKHPANRLYISSNQPPIDPATFNMPDPHNPLQTLKPKLLMPVYKRYYNVRTPVGSTEATELKTYYITPEEPSLQIKINGTLYRAERLAYLYMQAGGSWDYSKGEDNITKINVDVAPDGLYAHSILTNKRLKVKFRDGNPLNYAWDNIKPAPPHLEKILHPRAAIRPLVNEGKPKQRVYTARTLYPSKCITEKDGVFYVSIHKQYPTKNHLASTAAFPTYDEALQHLHSVVKKILPKTQYAAVLKNGALRITTKPALKKVVK